MERIKLDKTIKIISPTEVYVEWKPLNEGVKDIAFYGNTFESIEQSNEFDDIAKVEIVNAINNYLQDEIYTHLDYLSIDEKKSQSIDFIDEKIKECILSGFLFQGNLFSMSLEAQINWSNLLMIPDEYFPLQINTKEDNVYNLHFSNRDAFYMAAMTHKTTKLNLGTNRKQQVLSCNTTEEIDLLLESYTWE
jgi:hypothetical protein